MGAATGAVPAMKPEATAVGDPQDGRRKITLILMGAGFAYGLFRSFVLRQTIGQ